MISKEFPKYLIIVDGKGFYVPFRQAGGLANSYFQKVEIGGLVLEEDFSIRLMTEEEYNSVVDLADRIDERK